MTQRQTSFYKSFILCVSILLGMMVFGGVISLYLDRNVTGFNEVIDISGQQRMWSQRIVLKATMVAKYRDNPVLEQQFDEAVTKLIEMREILAEYHHKIRGLEDHMQEFFQGSFGEGRTRIDVIENFVNIAEKLSEAYALDSYDPQNEAVIKDLRVQLQNASDDILFAFQQKVESYQDFARSEYETRRIIRILLVVSFTTLIFVAVMLSFYPMHREVLAAYEENKKQRKYHEDERNRLELASRGAATGFLDWDIEKRIVRVNEVYTDILGWKNARDTSFTSDYFESLIHPDDLAELNTSIRNHIVKGTEFLCESRVKHQDGHYIWGRFKGEAIRDKTGHAYRMVGAMIDVTEQKQIQLRNNIFIHGMRLAKIPFLIIDSEDSVKKFTYASPAICDMTGFALEKILSSNLNMFTGSDTSMATLDKIDYALREQEQLSTKILHYRSTGESFWNNILIQPIYDQNNKFTNNYIVIFDDLTNEIAMQNKEIQRQRNESLGFLAGSVAHEINNLLMPMAMARDILENELKEDCDPFAREQLDVIADYANQAKEIVQGILTFSRKETTALKRVVLFEELQSSIQFIKGLLSSNTNVILHEASAQDQAVEAMVNIIEIRQIVTNLCRNAEQAFHDGKGDIHIRFENVKLSSDKRQEIDVVASDFIKISFQDNGVGIAQENLEKIFEPLFTTKDIGKGTGLGLSVVIGILKSWGGNITVSSVVGKGTTFDIYIPIYKAEEDYSDLVDLVEELQNGEA